MHAGLQVVSADDAEQATARDGDGQAGEVACAHPFGQRLFEIMVTN